MSVIHSPDKDLTMSHEKVHPIELDAHKYPFDDLKEGSDKLHKPVIPDKKEEKGVTEKPALTDKQTKPDKDLMAPLGDLKETLDEPKQPVVSDKKEDKAVIDTPSVIEKPLKSVIHSPDKDLTMSPEKVHPIELDDHISPFDDLKEGSDKPHKPVIPDKKEEKGVTEKSALTDTQTKPDKDLTAPLDDLKETLDEPKQPVVFDKKEDNAVIDTPSVIEKPLKSVIHSPDKDLTMSPEKVHPIELDDHISPFDDLKEGSDKPHKPVIPDKKEEKGVTEKPALTDKQTKPDKVLMAPLDDLKETLDEPKQPVVSDKKEDNAVIDTPSVIEKPLKSVIHSPDKDLTMSPEKVHTIELDDHKSPLGDVKEESDKPHKPVIPDKKEEKGVTEKPALTDKQTKPDKDLMAPLDDLKETLDEPKQPVVSDKKEDKAVIDTPSVIEKPLKSVIHSPDKDLTMSPEKVHPIELDDHKFPLGDVKEESDKPHKPVIPDKKEEKGVTEKPALTDKQTKPEKDLMIPLGDLKETLDEPKQPVVSDKKEDKAVIDTPSVIEKPLKSVIHSSDKDLTMSPEKVHPIELDDHKSALGDVKEESYKPHKPVIPDKKEEKGVTEKPALTDKQTKPEKDLMIPLGDLKETLDEPKQPVVSDKKEDKAVIDTPSVIEKPLKSVIHSPEKDLTMSPEKVHPIELDDHISPFDDLKEGSDKPHKPVIPDKKEEKGVTEKPALTDKQTKPDKDLMAPLDDLKETLDEPKQPVVSDKKEDKAVIDTPSVIEKPLKSVIHSPDKDLTMSPEKVHPIELDDHKFPLGDVKEESYKPHKPVIPDKKEEKGVTEKPALTDKQTKPEKDLMIPLGDLKETLDEPKQPVVSDKKEDKAVIDTPSVIEKPLKSVIHSSDKDLTMSPEKPDKVLMAPLDDLKETLDEPKQPVVPDKKEDEAVIDAPSVIEKPLKSVIHSPEKDLTMSPEKVHPIELDDHISPFDDLKEGSDKPHKPVIPDKKEEKGVTEKPALTDKQTKPDKDLMAPLDDLKETLDEPKQPVVSDKKEDKAVIDTPSVIEKPLKSVIHSPDKDLTMSPEKVHPIELDDHKFPLGDVKEESYKPHKPVIPDKKEEKGVTEKPALTDKQTKPEKDLMIPLGDLKETLDEPKQPVVSDKKEDKAVIDTPSVIEKPLKSVIHSSDKDLTMSPEKPDKVLMAPLDDLKETLDEPKQPVAPDKKEDEAVIDAPSVIEKPLKSVIHSPEKDLTMSPEKVHPIELDDHISPFDDLKEGSDKLHKPPDKDLMAPLDNLKETLDEPKQPVVSDKKEDKAVIDTPSVIEKPLKSVIHSPDKDLTMSPEKPDKVLMAPLDDLKETLDEPKQPVVPDKKEDEAVIDAPSVIEKPLKSVIHSPEKDLTMSPEKVHTIELDDHISPLGDVKEGSDKPQKPVISDKREEKGVTEKPALTDKQTKPDKDFMIPLDDVKETLDEPKQPVVSDKKEDKTVIDTPSEIEKPLKFVIHSPDKYLTMSPEKLHPIELDYSKSPLDDLKEETDKPHKPVISDKREEKGLAGKPALTEKQTKPDKDLMAPLDDLKETLDEPKQPVVSDKKEDKAVIDTPSEIEKPLKSIIHSPDKDLTTSPEKMHPIELGDHKSPLDYLKKDSDKPHKSVISDKREEKGVTEKPALTEKQTKPDKDLMSPLDDLKETLDEPKQPVVSDKKEDKAVIDTPSVIEKPLKSVIHIPDKVHPIQLDDHKSPLDDLKEESDKPLKSVTSDKREEKWVIENPALSEKPTKPDMERSDRDLTISPEKVDPTVVGDYKTPLDDLTEKLDQQKLPVVSDKKEEKGVTEKPALTDKQTKPDKDLMAPLDDLKETLDEPKQPVVSDKKEDKAVIDIHSVIEKPLKSVVYSPDMNLIISPENDLLIKEKSFDKTSLIRKPIKSAKESPVIELKTLDLTSKVSNLEDKLLDKSVAIEKSISYTENVMKETHGTTQSKILSKSNTNDLSKNQFSNANMQRTNHALRSAKLKSKYEKSHLTESSPEELAIERKDRPIKKPFTGLSKRVKDGKISTKLDKNSKTDYVITKPMPAIMANSIISGKDDESFTTGLKSDIESTEPDSIESDNEVESDNSLDSLEAFPAKYQTFAKEEQDIKNISLTQKKSSHSVSYFVDLKSEKIKPRTPIKKSKQDRTQTSKIVRRETDPKLDPKLLKPKGANINLMEQRRPIKSQKIKLKPTKISSDSDSATAAKIEDFKDVETSEQNIQTTKKKTIKSSAPFTPVKTHKTTKVQAFNLSFERQISIEKKTLAKSKDSNKYSVEISKSRKILKTPGMEISKPKVVLESKPYIPTSANSRKFGYMQSTVSRNAKVGLPIEIPDSNSRSVSPRPPYHLTEERSITPSTHRILSQNLEQSLTPTYQKNLEKQHSFIKESRKPQEIKKYKSTSTSKSASQTSTNSSTSIASVIISTKISKDQLQTKDKDVKIEGQSGQTRTKSQKLTKVDASTTKTADKKPPSNKLALEKSQKSLLNLSRRTQSLTKTNKSDIKISTKSVDTASKNIKSSSSTLKNVTSKIDSRRETTIKKLDNKNIVSDKSTKKTKEVINTKLQESKPPPIRSSVVIQTTTQFEPIEIRKPLRIKKHIGDKQTKSDDENYTKRCQSALQYASKDSIMYNNEMTKQKEPSSLPSSPNHFLRKSKSNGTKIYTSEVFTRTVDPSKSIEVIFRQPLTVDYSELVKKANEYKCADFDVSLIETTTDSSLSDSIALPSFSSGVDTEKKYSPTSPKPTKRPLQLIEDLRSQKPQQQQQLQQQQQQQLSLQQMQIQQQHLQMKSSQHQKQIDNIQKIHSIHSSIEHKQKTESIEISSSSSNTIETGTTTTSLSNIKLENQIDISAQNNTIQQTLTPSTPTSTIKSKDHISSSESSSSQETEQTIYTKEMSDETKVKFSIEDFPKDNETTTNNVKKRIFINNDYQIINDYDQKYHDDDDDNDDSDFNENDDADDNNDNSDNDDDDDSTSTTECIRKEAINLVDRILDESIMFVNAKHEFENAQQLQQQPSSLNLCNLQNDQSLSNIEYNSESDNYAITCDVVNGIDIVKSPTIESLSGRSFDDNMSDQYISSISPHVSFIITTNNSYNIASNNITTTNIMQSSITNTTNILRTSPTTSIPIQSIINTSIATTATVETPSTITTTTQLPSGIMKKTVKIADDNNLLANFDIEDINIDNVKATDVFEEITWSTSVGLLKNDNDDDNVDDDDNNEHDEISDISDNNNFIEMKKPTITTIMTSNVGSTNSTDESDDFALNQSDSDGGIQTSDIFKNDDNNIIKPITTITTMTTKQSKRYERIDKKFEKLSSQVENIDEFANKFDAEFDKICDKNEIQNLQKDFAKISWDESVSITTTATTADNTAADQSTPDNDLQDLPPESGGQTTIVTTTVTYDTEIKPKPTPRLSKTISEESKAAIDALISATSTVTTTTTTTVDEHKDLISTTTATTTATTELKSDDSTEQKSVTTEENNFKQSKIFWESLESQKTDSEDVIHKSPKPSGIPVPKPRTKTTTPVDSNKTTEESLSTKSTSISSDQNAVYSQETSKETSSEEVKEEAIKDEQKDITKEDEKSVSSSVDAESKSVSELDSKKPGFYIGDSSDDIIKRSIPDKRSDYAIDSEAYRSTLDDEQQEIPYDEPSAPSPEHDISSEEQKKSHYETDEEQDSHSSKSGPHKIVKKTESYTESETDYRKDWQKMDNFEEHTLDSEEKDIAGDSESPKRFAETLEKKSKIETGFEQADMDLTAAGLAKIEKEQFESRLFRQGSETRNDILEFEIEGKYCEESFGSTTKTDADAFIEGVIHDEASDTKFKAEQSIQGDEKVQKMEFTVEGKKQDDPTTFVKIERKSHLESADLKSKSKVETEEIVQTDVSPIEVKTKVEDYSHSSKAFETQQSRQEEITDDCSILKSDVTFTKTETKKISSKRIEEIHKEIHQIDVMEHILDEFKAHEEGSKLPEIESQKPSIVQELVKEVISSEDSSSFPSLHSDHSFLSEQMYSAEHHFPERKKSTSELAQYFQSEMDKEEKEIKEQSSTDIMHEQAENLEKRMEAIHQEIHQIDTVEQMIEGLKEHEKEIHHTEFEDYKKAEGKEISHETVTSEIITEFPATHETHISSLVTEHTEHFPTKEAAAAFEYDDDEKVFESHEEKISECMQYQRDEKILQTLHDGKIVEDKTVFQEMRIADEPQLKVGSIEIVKSPLQVAVIETVPSDEVLESDSEKIIMEIEEAPEIIAHQTEEETVTFEKAIVQGVIEVEERKPLHTAYMEESDIFVEHIIEEQQPEGLSKAVIQELETSKPVYTPASAKAEAILTSIKPLEILKDKDTREEHKDKDFLDPEDIFEEEALTDQHIDDKYKDKTHKPASISPKFSEQKVKFDHKLDLNLEKSETEVSEKYSKSSKSEEEFKKSLITDPSQVDTSMVVKTLEEVEESLDAVQEELIEVVKDGKLIKQSPSEFEFKILSSHHMQKYAAEPIHESFHEESSTTGSSSEQQLKDKPESQKTETTSDSLKTDDFASLSSTEDSSHRLDVVHRIKKDTQVDSLNRLSGLEQDHSSSSDSHYRSLDKTESSRPASSDLDNLITYGNSSEYQTALDASLLPESAEYVSAISSFDSSGKTISSQESMKSLDSELSNLGSVEISEASETLIGSIGEGDLDREIQEVDDIEFEVDDKLCGVLMEEAPPVCQMKRSQEMIFTQDDFKKSDESPEKKDEDKLSSSVEDTTGRTFRESTEKLSSSMDEASRLLEESKFSLEEGSLLSMSLSSASAVDTVVENIDDLASSLGASSLTGFEMQSLIRDDFTGTSFEEPSKIEKIDSMTMTISSGKDEDTNFANTQITTIVASSSVESSDSEPKRKGHKRSESTAFGTTDFLKGISKDSSSLEEEEEEKEEILEEIFPVKTSPSHDETATTFPKSAAVAAGLGDETKKGSESESDTDPYESEYARAFRSPTVQKKKSRKSVEEIFEKDQEPEKRPFTPSQLVSEVIEEDATEELESIKTAEELERRPSQNMQDYSNIPNITITEDRQRQLDEEDDEIEKFIREQDSDYKDDEQEKVLYKMKTQDELNKAADVPLKFAKEKECSMTDEQLNELIQQQYQRKLAEIEGRALSEEDKAPDSPDSFEMLEQPDISDEFVIIEEVAKEADEFDMEGKSVSIKPVKYEKKHDEEVEKILVSSAPADPHQGSIMYREGLNFEFEESPPTEQTQEEAEAADLAAANKRWVEMQMSDNGQMRYPYEVGGTVLEDIKEEDGELEVGSSRISSFKDSFSSTPEYDVLAGRKYFTKEHDDISMSSLQEFENLEQAISLENRKLHQHQHQGSQDSLSNGSFTRRYMARNQQGDDVSLSSLKEFEGLENACLEAHLIEIKAKEEAALLLSRSDESNKSGSGKDEVKGTNGTSITTTSSSTITQSLITSSTNGNASKLNQQQIEALIKSKLEECEEEPSNLMEVSTDSLDLAKKSKSTNNEEKKSELGSSDSLEINRSGDIMTSSIDSFEISKDATARSSRSEGDSLEQQLIQEGRRDSIDSIELEQAALQLVTSGGPEKQITISEFEQIAPDGSRQTITKTTTIMQGPTQVLSKTVTSTVTSSSITSEHSDTGTIQDPIKIIKNISSDSLNLTGQTDPDLLLTSTESLDRTSSAGTNATYQNENESIMTSSVTSCASSTLMENLESTSFPTELYQSMSTSAMTSSGIFPSSGQFTYEEMIPTAVASVLPTTATGTFSTIKTTTTTATTQVVTKSGSGHKIDEHKLLYEHSDLSFEKDFEKLDTASIQKPGGEEEQIIKSESKKSTEEPKK
ncbi:uncharacterized protein LOC129606941 [Condylostylus longicornis]|uniref:uncharacterized protein LOC129606941 n=1 Tax=Condylostylus longicornis TaxID=2530218 RepID=UPI00244DC35F|nr:uncharacterized protein LOC129606941 [Condylostylus longicornis]